MLRGERLVIAGGGIATVLTLPLPGLGIALPMLGGVALLIGAGRVAAAAESLATPWLPRPQRVLRERVLRAATAGLGIAVALQLAAVSEPSMTLGNASAMLRVVAVLALFWGMAALVDESRPGADPWHRALLVGLVTWVPLLGIVGSATWHIGTGHSDAAAFSVDGAGAVLVIAAAIAPLLALVPGPEPLEPALVPAVRR